MTRKAHTKRNKMVKTLEMFLSKYRSLEQRTASRVSPDCTYHKHGKPLCLRSFRAVHFRGDFKVMAQLCVFLFFFYFSGTTFCPPKMGFCFPSLLSMSDKTAFRFCDCYSRSEECRAVDVPLSPKMSLNLNIFSQAYSVCPSVWAFTPRRGLLRSLLASQRYE